jgi:nucleoside-diphosphate-sugar epimerase
MNILIAGVNGYIGSNLYAQLEQEFSIMAMVLLKRFYS